MERPHGTLTRMRRFEAEVARNSDGTLEGEVVKGEQINSRRRCRVLASKNRPPCLTEEFVKGCPSPPEQPLFTIPAATLVRPIQSPIPH